MSLPLRVLVCDDEAMARKRAERLVLAAPNVEVVDAVSSADACLARVVEQEYDIVFLDISMPGKSGIEAARAMQEPRPYIVFLTAHPEHAVEAFDVGAVDYLVKPADEERVARALDRARKYLEQPVAPRAGDRTPPPSRLALPTRDGAVLLDPAEITHCLFDGSLVTVVAKGKKVLTDRTLTELEQRLPHLLRVHRRALLNLDRVERLDALATGGYRAVTDLGDAVEISRQTARELRRRLGITA